MKTDVAVREKPILFSGEMVRAILENRKTQTRRVINPQPMPTWMNGVDWSRFYVNGKKELWLAHPTDPARKEIVCPYGAPGDRLWVREMLRRDASANVWHYAAGKPEDWVVVDPAHYTESLTWAHHKEGDVCVSKHMPRWASRISLEITEVRVQRVQEISEEDEKAEGCESEQIFDPSNPRYIRSYRARERFWELWDSINLKRGFGWDSNPWVWCVSFKRLP